MEDQSDKQKAFGIFDSLYPKVVVKFRDHFKLPYVDGVESKIESKYFKEYWQKLKKEFSNISLKRKFTSLKSNEISDLVFKAQKMDRTYKPVNFLSYFVIECDLETNIELLIKRLLQSKFIEYAYLDENIATTSSVDASDDPLSGTQGYLDAAPIGIDARYAWDSVGGDGNGIGFVDFEQGWTLNHRDLEAAVFRLFMDEMNEHLDMEHQFLG